MTWICSSYPACSSQSGTWEAGAAGALLAIGGAGLPPEATALIASVPRRDADEGAFVSASVNGYAPSSTSPVTAVAPPGLLPEGEGVVPGPPGEPAEPERDFGVSVEGSVETDSGSGMRPAASASRCAATRASMISS